jgi:hypothetical protein
MYRFVIFLSIFLFLSCNAEKKPPKKYLLTRDQIIPVLVDLHLTFGIQATAEFHELTKLYDSIDVHSAIFKKHNVEKAAFDSTMSYYSDNPEYLIDIYDEVIMRLSKLQDSIKLNE